MICTLPGEISYSIAVSSSSKFSWLLLGSLPLLNYIILVVTNSDLPEVLPPEILEACLLRVANCLKLAATSDVSRAISHGYFRGVRNKLKSWTQMLKSELKSCLKSEIRNPKQYYSDYFRKNTEIHIT